LSRPVNPRETIARSLEGFLKSTGIRTVHFAHAAVAPPVLAYVTSFPRLSVVLSGRQAMEVAEHVRSARVTLSRGHAIFVGGHCWNKPDWSTAVKELTFLFGKKQIGVSMVTHDGRADEPTSALKTTLSPFEGVTKHVIGALGSLAAEQRVSPLDRLLTEALLHACLDLLKGATDHHPRKAARTFETLCLFVQEHFQSPITREQVAENFGLTPNHVSRLFRREGFMRFSDYLTLVRIDRAKFMLKEYDSPLKEIAVGCGYPDVAYFCRVFRRVTKVTPTDYRLRGI
jgi:AraC-like DNA-binding protein